jgi:hypothetical protein
MSKPKPYIAVTYLYSVHNIHLQLWLARSGLGVCVTYVCDEVVCMGYPDEQNTRGLPGIGMYIIHAACVAQAVPQYTAA